MKGDVPIRAIWITAVTEQPPLPLHAVDFIDAQGASKPRAYDPTARYRLAGKNYACAFTPTGLAAILDLRTGDKLSTSDTPFAPLSFRVRKGARMPPVEMDTADMPTHLSIYGGDHPTALEYRWGFPGAFHATLRIDRVDDELTRWDVVLDYSDRDGSPLLVQQARYPVLPNLQLGDTADDDWFVAPGYAGHGSGVWYNPAAAPPRRRAWR